MIPPGSWTPKSPILLARKPLPPQSDAASEIFRRTSPELQMCLTTGSLASRLDTRLKSPEAGSKSLRKLEYFKDAVGAGASVADIGKAVGRLGKEAGEGLTALKLLSVHLAAIRQMQLDQASLKAELLVAQIGAASNSDAARSAEVFLKPMLEESEYSLAQEGVAFQKYANAYSKYGEISESTAGKLALQAETIMSGSPVGRRLMQVGNALQSNVVSSGLIALGALTTAWQAYDKSPAKSQGGKLADATASGVVAGAVDVALKRYPVVALADTALKYGGKYVGIQDPEKYTIGRWAQGTVNVYMAFGRAIWMWDSAPLDELQRQNMSGENGAILQGYAMMGQKLGEALYPAISKVVDWTTDVSQRHTKSQSWWNTLKN